MTAGGAASAAGPPGAFESETMSDSRQGLFNNISKDYDELNDMLSLGQHRVWKKMTIQWARAQAGDRALDICCGSGDIALQLAKQVGMSGSVVGLDFAQNMLDYADSRQRGLPRFGDQCSVEWVQGDAMQLPFPDEEFDAITMGYGLRNVSDRPKALSEIYRVLKPQKWAAVLDFNHSSNEVVDTFQNFVLENVVVLAARDRGLEKEYEYLRPSILAFPSGKEQELLAFEAGFSRAAHYEIGFGNMGVLVVQKEW